MKVLVLIAACFAATLAFEIPEPFKWDVSFQVDYEKLDEQHKGLFQAIYDLCAHKEDAAAFAHLKDVLEKHFRFEEGMMRDAHYDDLDAHRQIHEAFEALLKGGRSPVNEMEVQMAKDWLVNHIKSIDFKYKNKL